MTLGVCVRVQSEQKLLLPSTAWTTERCFRLSVVQETSWFLLTRLLPRFLPKKVCNSSVAGCKGHFYCTRQRLIPDWWTAEAKSREQVRACWRGGKNGDWNELHCSKSSAHEALLTSQTGSGENHTHVLPENVGGTS